MLLQGVSNVVWIHREGCEHSVGKLYYVRLSRQFLKSPGRRLMDKAKEKDAILAPPDTAKEIYR